MHGAFLSGMYTQNRKSFFMALAESAVHLAVVKTNEEFKSARQEDHVLCLQVLSEQDPIGGGGPNGQREL